MRPGVCFRAPSPERMRLFAGVAGECFLKPHAREIQILLKSHKSENRNYGARMQRLLKPYYGLARETPAFPRNTRKRELA